MLIAAVAMLIINIAAYPFLPDRVGIQIGFGGFTNYAPRWAFVLLSPVILLVIAASMKRDTDRRVFIAAVLVFVVNLAMIYLNLVR